MKFKIPPSLKKKKKKKKKLQLQNIISLKQ